LGRLDTGYALEVIREIDARYLEPAFLEAREDASPAATPSAEGGEAA
jgi:hypothetical protein